MAIHTTMSRNDTRQIVRQLYDAYGRGRVDECLSLVGEDVDFVSYAPVDVFPYLGRKKGKAALAQAMRAVHAEYEYITYQPFFTVVEDDAAAVILLARLKQRATGRTIQLFVADFLRLKDGKIYEIRQFMDSFDAVQQALGHELSLG